MRKSGGVLLLFFVIILAFVIYGAADSTTNGLPPTENGQVDPLLQVFWKVDLLGSILLPVILWFSNYHYTKAGTMTFMSDLLAKVNLISFVFGVWCWASLLGYANQCSGILAGVVAVIVNFVIVAVSESKALNDQHKDYLASQKK